MDRPEEPDTARQGFEFHAEKRPEAYSDGKLEPRSERKPETRLERKVEPTRPDARTPEPRVAQRAG
jgi:hypothetical protein